MKHEKLLSRYLRPELNIPIFMIVSLAAGAVMSPYFLDFRYLLESTTIYAELGVMAIALTLLMVAGDIDLSVASMMTFTACVTAKLYSMGLHMGLLIFIALIFGGLLGLFNGLIVTRTGLPSLIVTLGTMSLYRGLAQVLIGDYSISGFPKWFTGIDTRSFFGILPVSLVLLILLGLLGLFLLQGTFFGRKIMAVGLNSRAAEYSLVNVNRTRLILFVILGISCAVAGLLSMSRLHLAKYNIGIGAELDVITMVLLGGTAFEGGRGNTLGTLGAFLIIVFVRTGMMLRNLTNHSQIAVIGGLLILVLMLSTGIERLRKHIL
ncbi:MAG: ABC transporter permease [Spirochaetia bacterium]|nr:ABC transporter permease [Spirochaetia bacterium]